MTEDQVVKAVTQYRRSRAAEILVAVCMVVLMIGAVAMSSVSVYRQNAVQRSVETQECIARVTADFQSAVADALAAPPAPNAERELATDRIRKSARHLRSLDTICD